MPTRDVGLKEEGADNGTGREEGEPTERTHARGETDMGEGGHVLVPTTDVAEAELG